MFYCKACQEITGWPKTLLKSKGRCEICGKTAICYAATLKMLPVITKEMIEGVSNGKGEKHKSEGE
jgi:hypothetical protein